MISQPDQKITDLLKTNAFTRSAEIVPPRNGVPMQVILDQIAALIAAGAQFLAVTKGAGGSLRGGSLPIAQLIKERFHVPCIAHFTCRDLLPEEVENQLIDHHLFGIRNILALRGDPPVGEKNWQPREGSYPYAYQLTEQIRALNDGRYLERKGFSVHERERTDFCIGAAVYPDHSNLEEQIEFFKKKVDAGAEFAITQMLFNADSYARFVDACAKAGLNVPILPGTRLLHSKKQAHRMAERFQISVAPTLLQQLPEQDAASQDAALETFSRFTDELRTKGAPGLHLFVLSDTELAACFLKQLQTKNALIHDRTSPN